MGSLEIHVEKHFRMRGNDVFFRGTWVTQPTQSFDDLKLLVYKDRV